jgi:hypothetical protein
MFNQFMNQKINTWIFDIFLTLTVHMQGNFLRSGSGFRAGPKDPCLKEMKPNPEQCEHHGRE